MLHWDFSGQVPITLHGHLPFFVQFLEVGNLFSAWVEEYPLKYTSNNAPKIRDVLGTIMLSVLSGHRRYCHSAALYGDQVAANLMGVSHDSLSRGLKKMDEDKAEAWIHTHLRLKPRTIRSISDQVRKRIPRRTMIQPLITLLIPHYPIFDHGFLLFFSFDQLIGEYP